MDFLAKKFDAEIRDKMHRAKKACKYNPTRFNQMVASYGAVETAKRLIISAQSTGNISDGFIKLLGEGRLDLTMEHSVCKPEYAPLFTTDQIAYCKGLLEKCTR